METASTPAPISAIVICQDEADHIARCLESLASCAEIVVVDSGSTDGTLDLIRGLTKFGLPIRLFHQDWLGYARQKQHALDLATQPWVLSLDADEWLDSDMQAAIPRLIDEPDVHGWRLRRRDTLYAYGPAPAAVFAGPTVRLVRRDTARFDQDRLVHEGLIVQGAVRTAPKGYIRHERPLPLQEQMVKEIRYARLKAIERIRAGKRPSLARLLLNPPVYFLRIYLVRRMYLCGRAGFIHAGTGAAYSFMAEAMHFQMDRARKSAAHP